MKSSEKWMGVGAFLLVVLAAWLLVGCAPEMPVAQSSSEIGEGTAEVYPESDNGYTWAFGSRVEINTQVYKVTVVINDGGVNHQETNASGGGSVYGGYGYSYLRVWQEGKGILPVRVERIEPEFEGVMSGDYIVLKTSDLKVMAIPDGAKVVFFCNQDVEPLSPNMNGMTLTEERLTYELDDCRMASPEYVPGKEGE